MRSKNIKGEMQFDSQQIAKKKWFKDRSNIELLSMIAIPILLVFIFNYIPMFGLVIAFKEYRYDKGIWGSDWVGLEKIRAFIDSNDFPNLLQNTILNNALFIVFGIIAAVAVALLLFKLTSRNLTKVFQTILIMPHFVSWVLVSFLLYLFLAPKVGLLNQLMVSVGINEIGWYSEPKFWPIILLLAYIWKHVGMDSVIYYAALMGVDTSTIEAARIDGANERQVTRHVILPTIVPTIIILFILKVGNIFRADFGLFYNVPRNVGLLYDTTDVFDTFVYRMTREIGDLGLSSAAGFIQSIVGFVLVVLVNWIVKKVDSDSALF